MRAGHWILLGWAFMIADCTTHLEGRALLNALRIALSAAALVAFAYGLRAAWRQS